MSDLCFFDTNIIVYMYGSERVKQSRAFEIFNISLEAETLVISTQVVQEFYVAATRKLGLERGKAREIATHLCALRMVSLESEHLQLAMDFEAAFKTSYWDSLILAAARLSGSTTLYTEDLNHGQSYDGVQAVNPFRVTG